MSCQDYSFLLLSRLCLPVLHGLQYTELVSFRSTYEECLTQPFYRIQACPSVTFTIVVNPFNGPGPTPTPDACYTSEIPRLSVYPNVRLLGYVHTTYTTRSLDLVLRDVETYADWRRSSNIPGLEVAGIFVDETPWKHDEKAVQYLAELNRSVKESVGGFGSNGGIVVHNPGCVPHKAFLGLADTTVVFEDAYATFQQRQEAKLLDKVGDRSKLACLMHSVPEKMDGIEWRRMMREVRNVAGMVFITDLASGYYSNFGNCWERFANGMAE